MCAKSKFLSGKIAGSKEKKKNYLPTQFLDQNIVISRNADFNIENVGTNEGVHCFHKSLWSGELGISSHSGPL
jgi:hypothetical protein